MDSKNVDPSKGPFQMTETAAHKYGKTPQYYPCTHMALAHNTFIRSLNAIYLQSTSVTAPQDIADFLVYCQCWYESVHHHHAAEEEFFFPELERRLNKPGLMTKNVEQHHAFHDKLEAWGKLTYEMKPEDFDGHAWRRMIDGFVQPLVEHLHDELLGLESLAQELDEQGWKTMQDLWADFSDKMVAETNKSRIFPLALGAWDRNFEGGMHKFPEAPWFVPYMVDWVFGWKHRGAWRFSPSDIHGTPKVLKFVEA